MENLNNTIDTIDQQLAKRYVRSRNDILELLEQASNLEYDLNHYADYCDMESLFEASKHARSIYHLVRKALILKGEEV